MITRLCLLLSILSLPAYAVVHKGAKRREVNIGNTYGPPPKHNFGLPAPVYGVPGPSIKYGPPQQLPQVPHKEYGLPHREYGVPAMKYGPPKLNMEYGAPLHKNPPHKSGGGFAQSLQSAKSSIYEQIKSHFGVPKPSYGPPIQHPNSFGFNSGYGLPAQNYGPPPKVPNVSYGQPHKRAPVFGVPSGVYGLPLIPQSTGLYGSPPQPAGLYASPPQPVSNYGPPPTAPTPVYGPPIAPAIAFSGPESAAAAENVHGESLEQQLHTHAEVQQPDSNYLPATPPAASYGAPELGAGSSLHGNVVSLPSKVNHVHHTNGFGHEHLLNSVSCDGWKPIPGPSVHPVETSSSYSNVKSSSLGGVGGLTEDQLIAVALQAADESYNNLNSFGHDNNFHTSHGGLQAQSFSLQHGLEDSYSKPPADSYSPNSIHAQKYNGNDFGVGLVPPSDIYGVQSGGSYHSTESQNSHHHHHHNNNGKFGAQNLGIKYGSVSGNLKPWLTGGSPPKKPLFFRPPVPQGLLESIGASVQHLDQHGTKPENEPPVYVPPPASEVPNQHPDDQNLSPHASENIAYAQALPSIQEPRFNQAQDCGHGPNLNEGNFHYSQLHQSNNYDIINTNQVTSYSNIGSGLGQVVVPSGPADGNGFSAEYLAAAAFATSGDSYGPPASGNPGDTVGYESKQSSVSSAQASSSISDQQSSDQNTQQLPGLDNLNVVSAEKSHSLTIPVQGQHGTYQLQFQSANPIASALNSEEPANHEQILSQGLLQTIISAIEQPNAAQQALPSTASVDHNEVDKFFNSPEGMQVLSDPHEDHK